MSALERPQDLLAALRGTDAPLATAGAMSVATLSARAAPRQALLAQGVVAALVALLRETSPRSAPGRAASTAIAALARHDIRAADAALAAGVVPALLAQLALPPAEPSALAAAVALRSLAPRGRSIIWSSGAVPRLVTLLSSGAASGSPGGATTAAAAAEALGELCESGDTHAPFVAAGGVDALTFALGASLDTPLAAAAVGVLLKLSVNDALRPELQEAGAATRFDCLISFLTFPGPGRACWRLVNGYSAVEELTGGERRQPGARLQALLLIALLFCGGRDGNRAAGKLVNRFDLARHATCALQAASSHRCYLGVGFSPHAAVLYLRVLAENEDFLDRLCDAGAPSALAGAVSGGALGAYPPSLLHAAVAIMHLASRELAASASREARLAEERWHASMAAIAGTAASSLLCCAMPLPLVGADPGERAGPPLSPPTPGNSGAWVASPFAPAEEVASA